MAAGCDLATLSKQMGHSGIQVTSRYCHAKPGEAASCYINLSTTDIDESELTVEHKFVKKATVKKGNKIEKKNPDI